MSAASIFDLTGDGVDGNLLNCVFEFLPAEDLACTASTCVVFKCVAKKAAQARIKATQLPPSLDRAGSPRAKAPLRSETNCTVSRAPAAFNNTARAF